MDWNTVPPEFRYLCGWASKYGVRGLTVYFGNPPALSKLASREEIVELATAYTTIEKHGHVKAISDWCKSVRPGTAMNEAKEQIRGLLLLFERLGDRDLGPFNNSQVRCTPPDAEIFDWSVLPAHLVAFESWLRAFEELRTEHDLFEYVENATVSELYGLAKLSELLDREGDVLREWCEANNLRGNSAAREAFQAEWLFLLVDFAAPRIQTLE